MLTVYGIETLRERKSSLALSSVATVLTVYGIETVLLILLPTTNPKVATVLTVYGIETISKLVTVNPKQSCNSAYRLRY